MPSGDNNTVSGDLLPAPPSVERDIPLSDIPLSCFSRTIVAQNVSITVYHFNSKKLNIIRLCRSFQEMYVITSFCISFLMFPSSEQTACMTNNELMLQIYSLNTSIITAIGQSNHNVTCHFMLLVLSGT